MISHKNQPINSAENREDFTLTHYHELVKLAKNRFFFATYDNFDSSTSKRSNLIWWRHDVDSSINRAVQLARIERDEGVKATYFIMLHSEFYNFFEKSQIALLKEIIGCGHDIGLHFDPTFYEISNSSELEIAIKKEVEILQTVLDVRPVALSYHSPTHEHLAFDADQYCGLTNCYSRYFKKVVSYCSDSNGYWRFRRLEDVLKDEGISILQVLTHPECWQDSIMPHRQRIFRCAYGRAKASMESYDGSLALHNRLNHASSISHLSVLNQYSPKRYGLCDYLWNQGEFQTLFVELWRIHDSQINRLCKAQFRKEWTVPAHEVNAFFSSDTLNVDGWKLFSAAFNESLQYAAGVDDGEYQAWYRIRNQVVHGRSTITEAKLEEGCVVICHLIARLAQWGCDQSIGYDGLAYLGSVGLPTINTAEGSLSDIFDEVKDEIQKYPQKRWVALQQKLVFISSEIPGG
jgi:hypothetical protein